MADWHMKTARPPNPGTLLRRRVYRSLAVVMFMELRKHKGRYKGVVWIEPGPLQAEAMAKEMIADGKTEMVVDTATMEFEADTRRQALNRFNDAWDLLAGRWREWAETNHYFAEAS